MKTQRTTTSISRFPAIAWLRNQSDSVARVSILPAKSAKGCREAEWIVNPWLAKMPKFRQFRIQFLFKNKRKYPKYE